MQVALRRISVALNSWRTAGSRRRPLPGQPLKVTGPIWWPAPRSCTRHSRCCHLPAWPGSGDSARPCTGRRRRPRAPRRRRRRGRPLPPSTLPRRGTARRSGGGSPAWLSAAASTRASFAPTTVARASRFNPRLGTGSSSRHPSAHLGRIPSRFRRRPPDHSEQKAKVCSSAACKPTSPKG